MRNSLFTRLPFILGMLAGAMLAPILSELVGPAAGQSRDPAEGLDLSAVVEDLQDSVALIALLDGRVDDLEAKLAAVSVDGMSGAVTIEDVDLIVDGGNVHVRSGSDTTDGTVNGKGNLIVGYNELRGDMTDNRTGSHNLVIGLRHAYSSYGGLVAGESNTISGANATVSGGRFNTASGLGSSVSGGFSNSAIVQTSSVSGGDRNSSGGLSSSISGGSQNTASGQYSSVSGGRLNDAAAGGSSISGGTQRDIADNTPGLDDWRAGTLHEDF